MMKNLAQQKPMMESQMKKMSERLKNITVTGRAGAGMVEVTINGLNRVEKIEINDVMLAPENKSMIETLVASAFNDANDKMQQRKEDEGRKSLQDLGIQL